MQQERVNEQVSTDGENTALAAEWEAVIAPLDEDQMMQPGVFGDWSAKDLIGPISWYDREMVNVLQKRALVEFKLWSMSVDARNARFFDQQKSRSLLKICKEAQEIFNALWHLLEGLEEQDLHDPGRFSAMPQEWQPWEAFASNIYEHYEDPKVRCRRGLFTGESEK